MKAEKPPQLNAVIYTRVSTEEQGKEGTSLAGQYETCKRKAKELGATVIAYFEETESGALYQARGQLQKALACIESGEASLLILAKLDRTGRDVTALRDIRRRIEKARGHLVFADGSQFEQNAVGNLMWTQMSAFAEYERDVIRERTVAGAVRRAQEGQAPSRSVAPFGYTIATRADVLSGKWKPEQLGRYQLVESEAKWIPEIFERAARGDSLRAIATWLTENQVQSKGTTTAPPRTKWNYVTVYRMLQNSVYKGQPQWRKTRTQTDESRLSRGLTLQGRTERPESERITLSAPVLVSPELWERANAQIEQGRAARSGRTDRKYLLTGLLFCPRCGARMIAFKRSANRTRPDGTITRYESYYYRCYHSQSRARRQGRMLDIRCDSPCLAGPKLETLVLDAFIAILSNPSMIGAAAQAYKLQKKEAEQGSGGKVAARKKIEREIEKLKGRERAVAESIIDARVAGRDASVFETMRDDIAGKRLTLEGELAQMTKADESATLPKFPDHGAHKASLSILRSEDVPARERAIVLRMFFEAIYPAWEGGRQARGRNSEDGELTRIQALLQSEREHEKSARVYVLNYSPKETEVRVLLRSGFKRASSRSSVLEREMLNG